MNDASKSHLDEVKDGPWSLKLFVAGSSPASARAVTNLKRLVAEYLPKDTQIQIIDLSREWDPEDGDDVLAVPLLMRKQPYPPRRIIGDLGNTERVLRTLDLPVPGL
jgi:circadian clock protein KaiB